uniref:Uncharacterized protein n=1 Tax=Rhizophora mucronata TaxID=61149 RepID=A0A2P2LC26_RHIMU
MGQGSERELRRERAQESRGKGSCAWI